MGFMNKLLGKEKQSSSVPPPPPNLDLDIPPPPDFNLSFDESYMQVPPPAPVSSPINIAPPPSFSEPVIPQPVVQPAPIVQPQPIIPVIIPEIKPVQLPIEQKTVEADNTASDEKGLLESSDPEKEISTRRKEIIESNEPLFVAVDDYREILGATSQMKSHLKECEEILKRLNEVKAEEDKEYEKWKSMLLDIYRKVGYVDKLCFEQV